MFSSCFHLWHQLAITLTVWTHIQRWVQEICSHAVHSGVFLTLQLYLFMYNFLKFNLSLMSTNAPRCTELSCLWSFLWFNERIRGYGVYLGEYGLKGKQFKACLSDCSSLEEFHSVRVNFFCSYIFFLYVCACAWASTEGNYVITETHNTACKPRMLLCKSLFSAVYVN